MGNPIHLKVTGENHGRLPRCEVPGCWAEPTTLTMTRAVKVSQLWGIANWSEISNIKTICLLRWATTDSLLWGEGGEILLKSQQISRCAQQWTNYHWVSPPSQRSWLYSHGTSCWADTKLSKNICRETFKETLNVCIVTGLRSWPHLHVKE